MPGMHESRIATLERHCELLAAMLGTTCDDLDAVWHDYQTAIATGTPMPTMTKNGA